MNPDPGEPVAPRMSDDVPRRTVLAGLAGTGAVAGLAACGAGNTGTAPISTPPGRSVAKLDSIPVGRAIAAKVDGHELIVSRPTASTVACFSAICTHQGCTVRPQGDHAFCPCHGSVFSALTGKVIQTPAQSPLQKIPVTVENGEIVTG